MIWGILFSPIFTFAQAESNSMPPQKVIAILEDSLNVFHRMPDRILYLGENKCVLNLNSNKVCIYNFETGKQLKNFTIDSIDYDRFYSILTSINHDTSIFTPQQYRENKNPTIPDYTITNLTKHGKDIFVSINVNFLAKRKILQGNDSVLVTAGLRYPFVLKMRDLRITSIKGIEPLAVDEYPMNSFCFQALSSDKILTKNSFIVDSGFSNLILMLDRGEYYKLEETNLYNDYKEKLKFGGKFLLNRNFSFVTVNKENFYYSDLVRIYDQQDRVILNRTGENQKIQLIGQNSCYLYYAKTIDSSVHLFKFNIDTRKETLLYKTATNFLWYKFFMADDRIIGMTKNKKNYLFESYEID